MEVLLGLLAFITGFALRRGQTCAVLAMREGLERGRWQRFYGFVTAAAWAAVVAMPLAWTSGGGHQAGLAPMIAVTPYILIGGALFGLGAVVNGACAFGTLSRVMGGDIGFLFVLPGMALGAMLLHQLPAETLPQRLGANPFDLAAMPAYVAFGLALFLVGVEMARLRAAWLGIDAFARRLVWRYWSQSTAMAVIGLAGGALYAFSPDWSYGAAIDEVVAVAALGRPVAINLQLLLLVAAAIAGGVMASLLRGAFALTLPRLDQIGASILGGTLMGLGGGMIPGGNDGLVLYALPGLALYGILAYIAMNAAIAAVLYAQLRFGGPIDAPFPDEH